MSDKNTKVHPEVIATAREKIGELLAYARKEAGLSQKKLAEIAGIREATYIKLEKGRETNLSTLIAVVAALDGRIEITVK